MSRTTKIAVAALCAVLAGCAGPTGPGDEGERAAVQDGDLPGDGELSLAIGEEARFPGTPVRAGLTDVRGDSRCPIDAICVWAGDAEVVVALALGTGPSSEHVLHWNTGAGSGSATVGDYRVSLVALDPMPLAGEVTRPEDYRVRLKVEGT